MSFRSLRDDEFRHPGGTRWVMVGGVGLLGASILLSVVGAMALGRAATVELVAAAVDSARAELSDLPLVGPTARRIRQARRYEVADPERDAQKAIASGDLRFLAAAGLGPFIPGTDHKLYEELRRRYGVRFLYQGCVIESPADERYRGAAYDYAVTYNTVLLSHVQETAAAQPTAEAAATTSGLR